MEEKRKVYCKDCKRWYGNDIDQCNIPSCGIEFTQHAYDEEEYKKKLAYLKAVGIEPKIDKKGVEFITTHLKYIHFVTGKNNMIYGHPSQLNKDNDCYFYLPKNTQRAKRIINAIKNFFGRKKTV